MSDQIDTGYADPPEQWIVAPQVQPAPVTAGDGGARAHAARPGAMATVAESHGELVDRCHRAEARVAVLESELAAERSRPSPLDRLEAWLRQSRDNYFDFNRSDGRWIVRLYNYRVDCAGGAPTLAGALKAALDEVEAQP